MSEVTPISTASTGSANAAAPRKLFRDEAIAHAQEKFWGEVLVSRSLTLAMISLGALALAGALAAYLAWGEYTRKVKVGGYLAPQVGVVRVAAGQAGVLTQLLEAGAKVKVGDVIATISLERDPGSQARQTALKEEIARRRESLKTERARLDTNLEDQLRQSSSRESNLKLEMEALTNEMKAQADRMLALQSVAERHAKLFSEGFIGPNLAEQKKSDALEQKIKLETLRRTRAQLLRDIQVTQGDRRTLALKRDSQQGELDRQLSTLDREQVDTDDRAREVQVTAPIDGTVATSAATRGQTIAANGALVALLPENNELQAELMVPTRAAGFIKPGQAVALRYQAFPFERFGHAMGTVKEVGATILNTNETGPLAAKEPVYRVVVTLPLQSVNAYGQAMALRSGMLLDADIQLEKRKLYEWIIEPIIAAVGRA